MQNNTWNSNDDADCAMVRIVMSAPRKRDASSGVVSKCILRTYLYLY